MSLRSTVASFVAIVLFVSVAILLSSRNPLNPNRDAGVFLYIGQQILEGKLPYVSTWDHKPPGIYYVDALGIAMTGGRVNGVWILEILSAAVAGVLSWNIFRRRLSFAAATSCVVVWLAAWMYLIHGSGNYTEEFALPFQFGALHFFDRDEETHATRRAIFIALLGACAFLLKPTTAAISIAIGIVWLAWGTAGNIRKRIAPAIAAGSTALVAVAIAFHLGGAFDDLYDEFIHYNSVYAGLWSNRFFTDPELMMRLALSGVFVAAFVSWVVLLLAERRGLLREPLARVAVIAFPLELLIATGTRLNYDHYFITVIPSASILFAFLVERTGRHLRNERLLSGIAIASMALSLFPLFWTMNDAREVITGLPSPLNSAITLARDVSPDQSVFVWGAEVEVNALAQRRAPSRYAYLYPLLTRGYATTSMGEEFLRDLQRDPPAVIFDASATDRNIPPLDAPRRRTWTAKHGYDRTDVVEPAATWIERSYRSTRTLPECGWTVWTKLP